MHKTIIIVAGGSGTRMNSEIPKQFLELNGFPVIMHTIKCFIHYDPNIEVRIVLPKNQVEFWKELCQKHNFAIDHSIMFGGEKRFDSVKNGLEGINRQSLVAIHDAVRPLVSRNTISRCFEAAGKYGSAIPVINVHETIRKVENNISYTVDRNNYKLVQTPQVFKAELLLKAYQQPYSDKFTDDASVVESSGHEITLVDGNRENIKITTPDDLIIANAFLSGGSIYLTH